MASGVSGSGIENKQVPTPFFAQLEKKSEIKVAAARTESKWTNLIFKGFFPLNVVLFIFFYFLFFLFCLIHKVYYDLLLLLSRFSRVRLYVTP